MEEVSKYSPLAANILIILFVFIMNFIINNMVRAIISHSYLLVVKDSNKPLSIDEQLEQKHWIVRLLEYKDPLINKTIQWISTNRK